ncbi:MAG: hypothetical protein AAFX06_25400 [Planctomycetota bacterium]
MNLRPSKIVAVALLSFATTGVPTESANAQVAEDDSVLITKFYDVADLLDPPFMLGGKSEPAMQIPSGGFGGMGGGMGGGVGGGGMGAMGGAPAGGGGMFRMPDDIRPQLGGFGGGGFGGGGMGGMGGGGMGGGMSMGYGGAGVQRAPITFDSLTNLMYEHVGNDDSWLVNGGDGRISNIGNSLVVTNTSNVHAQVESLLKLLREERRTMPLHVDVRVVEITESISSVGEFTPQKLDAMAGDESAARLTLRCNNHQSSKVSAGLKRSYVVSITPVVGGASDGNSSAYQPVTESVLLGLFGHVRPDVARDQKTAMIHLGIELAAAPEEVDASTFGTGESIDRMEIESATLETSVQAVNGNWTLAGLVAVANPTSIVKSGEALPHLAVLVRWKASEGSPTAK